MTERAGCMAWSVGAAAAAMASAVEDAVEPLQWRSVAGIAASAAPTSGVVVTRAAGTGRQVLVGGLVAELRHQVDAAARGDQRRYVGVRVVEVAEVARAAGAGLHAGRLALGFVEVLVVDAVHAQGALLHPPLDFAVLARSVGAGPAAQLAADALVLVDQHDAVLGALVACARRTHGDA